jgi:hypothetical protein
VFTTSIKNFASSTFSRIKKSHLRPATFDSESFFLPPSTITPQFLEDHVQYPTKRAQLADLTQPNFDLRAILSEHGMHIYDRSSRTWVTCIKKQGIDAQKLEKPM